MHKANSTRLRKATDPGQRLAVVVPGRQRPRRTTAPRRLTLIDYVENRDAVNALFGRIVSVLRPTKTFFNQMGRLVFVQAGIGVVPVTPQNLNGYLSSYLEIRYQTQLLSVRPHSDGIRNHYSIRTHKLHLRCTSLFDTDFRFVLTNSCYFQAKQIVNGDNP